eukprot:gene26814-4411_t
MAATQLVLDQAVRDWVFLPLTLCIVFMKLIQQYAHMMMNSVPKQPNKEANEIRRCNVKEYFVGKDTGFFHQKAQSRSMQEAMATDPSIMLSR